MIFKSKYKAWIIAFMLISKILVITMLILLCTSSADSEKYVLENIHGRTSIRNYTGDPVPDEKIRELLKAAMAAPSSRNIQPWLFYVVKDREKLDRLAEGLPFAKMLGQAQVAIVVCGDTQKGNPNQEQKMNWVMDCSAATQNLLLAAHALGLGAVWTGVYPYEERIYVVRETLEIPEHVIPLNVIPIGYPAENPKPKNKWNPENIVSGF